MDSQSDRKEIIYWADFIRVVAIYLVVVTHVSGQITNVWGEIPTDQWIIADTYGGIARICVPLFFMTSGYLLLPRSESLSDFYSKRIMKILLPLIVWSLIYLRWYCDTRLNACTPNRVWDLLLVKGTSYHLWYLYSLIGIYLILPVLRLIIRPDANKILWYLIVLWLIFQPILTLANKFWGFRINIGVPLVGGFVCYFILGYLLSQITWARGWVVLFAVLWVTATLITIIGAYISSNNAGQFDRFFYDFGTLNVILASGSAFILLRWISETQLFTSPQVHALTRLLATSAFGIYLIHVIVIEVLSGWIPFLQVSSFIGNAIWSIPLVSTIVFAISFLVVHLFQRVPILRYIVP